MKVEAYGETIAPEDVDTLRDAACPVCGEDDSYDGDTCQVCGFVSPPKMFQDPNLEKARELDLRKDQVGDDQGLPEAAPGGPGENQNPMDEEMVNPDALDEEGVVDGEARGLGDEGDDPNLDGTEQPLDPEADPDAATGHVNQGGEPFTPGPNAPRDQEFMDPAEMEDPEDEDEEQELADGQAADGQEVQQQSGLPGEPGDGVADLLCPACGFGGDAATPTSTPGNTSAPTSEGDGLLAGDICPNCAQATLMSKGELEVQQEAMQGQPPMR